MANFSVAFTVFASVRPLTKLFDVGPDGKIRKSKGVAFSFGRAGRFDLLTGATPGEILARFSDILGQLNAYQAIGLGVEKSGLPIVDVVTVATAQDGDISRTLEHWHYPPGSGLFGVDLDSGRDFNGLAAGVYPPWADLATATRASVSAGISNPETGETFEGSGEHIYTVIDDLPRSKAAAQALDRLFWQAGLGRVMVGIDGKLHPRSPIDLAVYSPERVIYEGAPRLMPPIVAAPRACTIRPGGVLVVSELVAYADARISAADVYEMFVVACRDSAIQAEAEEKNAAWNAERVKQGKPPILIGRRASKAPRSPRAAPSPREPPRAAAEAPPEHLDALARIAVALGGSGRPSATGWHSCRCPVHADHRPSLSLAIGDDGRLVTYCHAGCDQRLVKMNLTARGLACDLVVDPSILLARVAEGEGARRERFQEAGEIWHGTVPLFGTPAEDYLTRVRCIGDATLRTAAMSLRWHPGRFALVAKVMHPFEPRAVGVQLTFLERTTHARTVRRFVGSGGVVKLAEGEGRFVVGEGIETVLSGAEITGAGSAWATLGTSGLARLRLPLGVRDIGILIDRDTAGDYAAREAFRRLVTADPTRRVRRLSPPEPYDDFNAYAVALARGKERP